MTINDFQASIASTLTADPYMAERVVTFVPETLKDIIYEVEANIRNQGINATVMTPDLQFQGLTDVGDPVYTINNLTIQVGEYVTVNRNKPSYGTGQDVALRASAVLLAAYPQKMVPTAIKTTVRNELLIVTLTFKTAITVAPPSPLEEPLEFIAELFEEPEEPTNP